ncbi:MAG: hypothetical protein ACQES9_03395 [Myxococcota bacterium]
MKNISVTIFSLFVLLFTTNAAAQMYGEGPGSPGLMQPHRVGFIHEGSLTSAFLTGEGGQDYNGSSAGIAYSGLFRSTPNFAYGVHMAYSQGESSYDYTLLHSIMVGGEARIYIPVDLFELWGGAFVGLGGYKEVYDEYEYGGGESDWYGGLVTGFGAGIDYYVSPNWSFGVYLRLYKIFYEDGDAPVFEGDDSMTYEEYYGLWGTIGFSASVHY